MDLIVAKFNENAFKNDTRIQNAAKSVDYLSIS